MLRSLALLAAAAGAAAFSTTPALSGIRTKSGATCIQMQAEGMSRRELLKGVAAAAAAVPAAAFADVEYPNVPYLGGSDKIDVNNANIRVYTKFPGMYPSIAGKIVKAVEKKGAFKSIEEVYDIATLTDSEKEVIKKYQNNLVALDQAPEYLEDIWNNGLYR